MANTKFENATTWLQGVISGYQKQVNNFSAAPNPDANKIKACKERQELCQYILDFMVKAKQQNDVMAAKSSSQNTAAKPQNAPQSISAHSMANTMGKEQPEQLELILGLDATISFCRAALILELPEFGSKEALLGTLKDFVSKRS
nr:MAG TPA: hypothetical protein [Bacteriophage sp.]